MNLSRPDGGGMPARRALVRWTVRMFRREWRQQILVLGLLTVAVATSVGLACTVYNLAPVSGNAEFGSAHHSLIFEGTEPQQVAADIAAAREWFSAVDVITHKAVAVPGRFEPLDLRSQDPEGPFGAPLLALLDGRYPTDGDEAAITDGVANELDLAIDGHLDLDGTSRTVVGVVENPSDLTDEFALVRPDDAARTDSALLLVDDPEDRVLTFRPPSHAGGMISGRGTAAEGAFAASAILGASVVALLFIALLAAASFVVVARRRQRQLGMLAAVGATARHVRMAMLANGIVVGGVAAVVGAVLGAGGWLVLEPAIEAAAGYRIERLNIPWWVVVTGMTLAVVAAAAAAWWPSRVASRLSIVQGLSGRPEPPRAVHRSAAAAAVVAVAGAVALGVAGDPADQRTVHWSSVALIAVGTLAVVAGVLLVCPLAVRLLGAVASRVPVAPRIALRDLARNSARSSAALAAIVLALGIPSIIAMAATAAQTSAEEGNLPNGQLIVRGDYGGPFVPEARDVASLRAGMERVADTFDNATVIELDAALDPLLEYPPEPAGRLAITVAEQAGEGWSDIGLVYVATPELIAASGVDPESLDPSIDFLSADAGPDVGLLGVAQDPGATDRRKVEPFTDAETIEPTYSSLPTTFVTAEALAGRGWEAVPSGRWIVVPSRAPEHEELAAARDLAASVGLTVEQRDDQAGLSRLRSGATAVGVLLALGVLAMTVGLVRSETAADLRTLTAAGATSRTRRALTAVTAGALAAVGAALGLATAFAVLTLGYLDEMARLPLGHLLAIALATPAVAAAAGWLLAGREPPAITRQALE